MIKIISIFLLLSLCKPCFAQQEVPLYVGKVPNSKGLTAKEQPTLSIFLPAAGTATGTAVIVCPGGGYQGLVKDREGTEVAKAFNKAGIAAFVLKYRLPNEQTMDDKSIGPLQDAQQAIKTVRESAKTWGINPDRIGIMGFSAGGHLASTVGTHFSTALIENNKNTSLRPDFMLLIYPVISMKEGITHAGSRRSLIGTAADAGFEARVEKFSNELQVSAKTPATFLTHAVDDSLVPLANTMLFFEALNRYNVPVDLHVYHKGEHGYLKYPAFNTWFANCLNWIQNIN